MAGYVPGVGGEELQRTPRRVGSDSYNLCEQFTWAHESVEPSPGKERCDGLYRQGRKGLTGYEYIAHNLQ